MLPKKEFDFIYSRVPRFGIELVIVKDNKILLTKRTIEPGKGCWHLPGTTLAYGESLKDLLIRVAKQELNGDIQRAWFIDNIEYIHKDYHVVSKVYVTSIEGNLKPDFQASQIKWFKKLPVNMFPQQREFIKKYECFIFD